MATGPGLATVVALSLALGGPSCNMVNNTDFQGEDLKVGTSKTAGGCCAECASEAGCSAWTLSDPQPGTQDHDCFVKSGSAHLVPDANPGRGGHVWSGLVVVGST